MAVNKTLGFKSFSSKFMMMLIDTLIFLLWGLFFLAAVVGLLQEYRSNQHEESKTPVLEDDDPVFLV